MGAQGAKAYGSDESSNTSSGEESESASDDESTATQFDIKKPLAAVDATTIIARATSLISTGTAPVTKVGCRADNAVDLRVQLTAHGLANGVTLYIHHQTATRFSLRCRLTTSRRVSGQCTYHVHASKQSDGSWTADRESGAHQHPLDEPVTRFASNDSLVAREGEQTQQGGKQKEIRQLSPNSTSHPRLAALKRSSGPFQQITSSPKRSATSTNAVASGSGSRGTPATQYHTGSASRPSTSSRTTSIPQNTTVTPSAPLPWPRELARLVASVNPLLLSKSHAFSKLLIPIGVVNRHEFSKMIWSFGATDQHDKRMNWFKIHLRKGNELVEMDFMQFRIGATRICAGIPKT